MCAYRRTLYAPDLIVIILAKAFLGVDCPVLADVANAMMFLKALTPMTVEHVASSDETNIALSVVYQFAGELSPLNAMALMFVEHLEANATMSKRVDSIDGQVLAADDKRAGAADRQASTDI